MGNKNSGRRTKSIERLRDDLTVASYAKSLEAIQSSELKLKEQADIAVKIASKDIGRKLEHSGSVMQINITPDEATGLKLANDRLARELG